MNQKRPRSLFRDRQHGHAGGIVAAMDALRSPESALAKCCVIVPFRDAIVHPVEDGLRALEELGVKVFRRGGCSAIDFARSALASMVLVHGYESVLFIDSDVFFHPADAIRLLRRSEPIVAGIYAQKRAGKLNALFYPETTEIPWGDQGIDLEVRGIGAGFLRITKNAFQTVTDFHQLPTCQGDNCVLWPFFLPMVAPDEYTGDVQYLCEDMSFCRMAREAGLKVIADTRIRLSHIGNYEYTYADASHPPTAQPMGGVIPMVFPS